MRKFFSVMRNPKINVAATAVCFSALSAHDTVVSFRGHGNEDKRTFSKRFG